MSGNRRRIVVIGATSAIAEHCARLWAGEGADLVLVARDSGRLARAGADLKAREAGGEVREVVAEFLDPAAIRREVDAITADRAPDVVLIAHGSLPDQAACQDDLALARQALEVNAVSPALWAEAFAKPMVAAGRGTIALIGSVAGDRGRKSNYVYGSAKGLVARYAQGLQHRLAKTGVKVVLIKPGPTDTPMTAELKAKGMKLAPVADAARQIKAAIDRGAPVAYVPAKWRLIMMVIRHMPAFVFNRLDI